MAKQTGIFHVIGSLGNATFYKTKDGYKVRTKSSLTKARIKSDPAFKNTREHCAEFGSAAKAGRLFRTAFRPLIHRAGDKSQAGAMTRAMLKVIQEDEVNPRGQRTIKDGQPLLLEGFEFNQGRTLSYTLGIQFSASIDQAKGAMVVDIPAFSPSTMVSAPEGATHFRLFSGGAAIDFEAGSYDVASTESAVISIGEENVSSFQLIQKVKPHSPGTMFLLLGIEFLQVCRKNESPLRNAVNALAVVKVL